MTTFRIQHDKNFTTIHNKTLQDDRLSFRARGLHHLLLSFPNDWVVNEKHLIKQSPTEGREAIRTAMKELMDAGYVVRTQTRSKGQFSRSSYDVFEMPQPTVAQESDHGTVSGLAVHGSTGDDSIGDGQPDDIQKTNSIQTNDLDKSLSLTTTTERPKKKASSSSEGESASLDKESLEQSRKVAEHLGTCGYWGDDGVEYSYRNNAALVKACKGHTDQTATKCMIAANEFMDGQRRKGLEVESPQGILCKALRENWQPSALAEAKHDRAMQERLKQLSQAEQADFTVEWLGLMEQTGIIQDVQIDRLAFSYTFRYHDDPTGYCPSLDTLPPRYQHVTMTQIRDTLNQRVAA